MTELIGEDFETLFRFYRHSAFRLEVQPVYTVAGEQEAFARYLAGQPQPPTEIPYFMEWLDQIRQVTAEGRRVERVRVIDDPPTDYQRWEAWAGQWNIAAGEVIRYIDRAKALALGIPLNYDWWLFDDERLAIMRFDEIGRPLGGTIVNDPETVVQHQTWRDLAVRSSTAENGAATAT
jgi:hypothetical protein